MAKKHKEIKVEKHIRRFHENLRRLEEKDERFLQKLCRKRQIADKSAKSTSGLPRMHILATVPLPM